MTDQIEQRLKEIEARCPFAEPVPGGDPSFVDSAKDVPALCKALRRALASCPLRIPEYDKLEADIAAILSGEEDRNK